MHTASLPLASTHWPALEAHHVWVRSGGEHAYVSVMQGDTALKLGSAVAPLLGICSRRVRRLDNSAQLHTRHLGYPHHGYPHNWCICGVDLCSCERHSLRMIRTSSTLLAASRALPPGSVAIRATTPDSVPLGHSGVADVIRATPILALTPIAFTGH